MSIENTQTPNSIHATALLALATGDTSAVIEGQERAGQGQLVNSDRLPTKIETYSDSDGLATLEALGFTFGGPDPDDPLFQPATLPEGWVRQASDHSMWSYIADQYGRRRVAIFYKAAFYDRRASMSLVTVAGYVAACQQAGVDVITDDTWATPAAVAEAARKRAEAAQQTAAEWATASHEDAPRWKAEAEAERDAYLAIAAKHTTGQGQS
ncbi:hypothetical protein GTY23_23160 [Streptomyces sp. SID5998]|nr:hypothetical protein [Streptomyces sp. SID5998]